MNPRGRKPRPIEDRFWVKVNKTDESGCWLWLGSAPDGRGAFWVNESTTTSAPKMAWILTYGPVPPGLDVLNECGNRMCVNPSHLVLDSRKTNRGGQHRNATKTHCPRGHLYDSVVQTKHGERRRCLVCHSTQEKVRRNLGTDVTISDWDAILTLWNYECVYCGAPWEHMDHFVPLSKGGTHTADNVVPACLPCNLSKNNKDPLEFIGCD